MPGNQVNLTPDTVRSILGVPEGERIDRALEFMRCWQEIRLNKKHRTLTLKFENGKEVHAEEKRSF